MLETNASTEPSSIMEGVQSKSKPLQQNHRSHGGSTTMTYPHELWHCIA